MRGRYFAFFSPRIVEVRYCDPFDYHRIEAMHADVDPVRVGSLSP